MLNVNLLCKSELDQFYNTKDKNTTNHPDAYFFDMNNDLLRSKAGWMQYVFNNYNYNLFKNMNTNAHDINPRAEYHKFFSDGFAEQLFEQVTAFYDEKYFNTIMDKSFDVKQIFIERINVTEPDARFYIIGDIHGSLWDLFYVLCKMKDAFVNEDSFVLKEHTYLIFLGDIVDYSMFGIESIALVYLLLIWNPYYVYILNGNHEDEYLYNRPGQYGEEVFYQLNNMRSYWMKLLNYLPVALYIKIKDKTYHFSHGAFDPEYCLPDPEKPNNVSKLNKFLASDKQFDVVTTEFNYNNQYKWGDFYQTTQTYDLLVRKGLVAATIQDTELIPNKYGIVPIITGRYIFYPYTVRQYLEHNNLECIISGHQDNVAFGFISDKDTDTEYALHSSLDKGIYSLYTTKTMQNIECFNNVYTLKPLNDFLAMVTSNASQTKLVTRLCYLILCNHKRSIPKKKYRMMDQNMY